MKAIRLRASYWLVAVLWLAWLVVGLWNDHPVRAENGRWSTPFQLSSAEGSAWFSDIAADPFGNVHVVWGSGDEEYDTVMYRSRDIEGTWRIANDIVALPQYAGQEATRPSIAVGHNNNLHLTYRYTTIWYSQSPIAEAHSAAEWREPYTVSEGYFSQVVEDDDGLLHIVYTRNTPSATCDLCYHVYYIQSDDGGMVWTAEIDISQIEAGAAKPQLWVTRNGELHVVWEAGYGGSYGQLAGTTRVMYTRSLDRGQTWRTPIMLAETHYNDTSDSIKNITIAQDKNDHLIVVWWDLTPDQLFYQRSTDDGESWTQPAEIPGIWGIWTIYQSRLDRYSMAVDSGGTVHLLAAGRSAPGDTIRHLYHLTWDGSSWSRPISIAQYQDDMPEWPRIAVGLGNRLHATWFIRDAEGLWSEGSRRYSVWYAESESAAESFQPLPMPTVTGTAEPEPVVVEITPEPTESEADRSQPEWNADAPYISIESLQNETPRVGILLLGLGPSFLLVSSIVLMFWKRRSL